MSKKLEVQIENLAIAVHNGFKEMREEMDRRFTEVDQRFDRVEMLLLGHTNRIEILEDKVRLISTKIGL